MIRRRLFSQNFQALTAQALLLAAMAMPFGLHAEEVLDLPYTNPFKGLMIEGLLRRIPLPLGDQLQSFTIEADEVCGLYISQHRGFDVGYEYAVVSDSGKEIYNSRTDKSEIPRICVAWLDKGKYSVKFENTSDEAFTLEMRFTKVRKKDLEAFEAMVRALEEPANRK